MCGHLVQGSNLACSARLHDRPYAEWCKPCLIDEIHSLQTALCLHNVAGMPGDEPPQSDDFPALDGDEWLEVCEAVRNNTPLFTEAS